MWQRLFVAVLLMSWAACSQVLGVKDISVDDGGSNNQHYDGLHYGYVVDRVFVPTVQSQVQQYGLDLGNAISSKLDGIVDNSFGTTLAILSAQSFPTQQKINSLIDRGDIIHLIDLQTADFVNAGNVGLTIKTGQNPVPSACNSSVDSTCRHHLTGTGAFAVSFESPTDATIGGKITNNVLDGYSNVITLQIIFDGNTLVNFNLIHARISATLISESNIMTATVAGLITRTDLITKIVPVIQDQFQTIIESNCGELRFRTPPNCSCTGNSAGDKLLRTFDGDVTNGVDRDCQISTAEILEHATLDSCSKESCTTADSISVGLKIEAVKAVFPL